MYRRSLFALVGVLAFLFGLALTSVLPSSDTSLPTGERASVQGDDRTSTSLDDDRTSTSLDDDRTSTTFDDDRTSTSLDDDRTSTTFDDDRTSTTFDDHGGNRGSDGDDDNDAQATSETRVFSAGSAGSVTIDRQGDRLDLAAVSANAGWSYEIKDAGGDRVEVRFENGKRKVELRVDVDDGVMSTRLRDEAE